MRRSLIWSLIQISALLLLCYLVVHLVSSTGRGWSPNRVIKERTGVAGCPDCTGERQESPLSARDSVIIDTGRNSVSSRKISAVSSKLLPEERSPYSVSGGQAAYKNSSSKKQIHKKLSSRWLSPLPTPKCSDKLCTEFLGSEDWTRFNGCLQKLHSHKGTTDNDGQCRFMPQHHRAPVALASYPGSGNTWLRGLLETATGICTGFEFCDISMRVKGFAGENIVSGAVLVVKTHGYPNWKKKKRNGVHFDSAVFLIRNPLDALVAEWNRRVANNFKGSTVSLTSHVKSAGEEMFGSDPKWAEFVRDQVPRWQQLTKEWITSHERHAILVVKYEDLLRNSTHQVKRILTFLQVPYREKDIAEKLAKGFSAFHRNHKPEFEHYTPGQRERVIRAINDTIELLKRSRLSHLLDIHDYLHSS